MASPVWSPDATPDVVAPAAMAARRALDPAARRAVDSRLGAAVRAAVWSSLGHGPAGSASPDREPGSAVSGDEEADDRARIIRFAEQFTVDVAALSEADRRWLGQRFGARAFPLVQVMWVADFGARADAALGRLFAASPAGPRPSTTAELDLWPAVDAFLVEVARLDHLDPITTEVVRLRGARAHNCRLCRSRRLRSAVRAGADETMFDQIDDYERGELSERHKVALRLTDAMVWSPSAWPAGLADQVRGAFDPAEATELVLDVTRNSANKIAVALGADAAEVADGEVDYFDIGPDGQLISGLVVD
jgi:alkylhydroperoxidase family enzyme